MVIKVCRTFILMAMIACLVMGLGILPANAGPGDWGKVELYEQNALGQIKSDGAKGKLDYILTGPGFEFILRVTKLDKNTSYSLILSREPEVMLPGRYNPIATGTSDSGGSLYLSGSVELNMDLIAARFILIPADQPPNSPVTYQGKYLFATSALAYDDTESNLVCGGNQSPGPSGWDLLGLQKGDQAVNFSLYGIDSGATLYPGNQEQPLTLFTLYDLLQSKPVLLVNGAFT